MRFDIERIDPCLNAEKSLLPEDGAPRMAAYPVFGAVLSTVPHQADDVVGVREGAGSSVNPSFVAVEGS